MDIEALLIEEIKSELEELENIEIGTDEYKVTVDGLTKLVDRALDYEKLKISEDDQVEKRKDARALAKFENDLKIKQMKDEQVDRWVKNGIAVVGIMAPLAVTIWGTIKTFKFEEDGTITTTIGRGFINKLLPRK